MTDNGGQQVAPKRRENTAVNDDKDATFCYLKVSIAGLEPPETVVIELFQDKVPQTCRNFLMFCTSKHTTNKSNPQPTYRGTEFHRIIPKFMVQGGDFENFDGSGGYAYDYSITGNKKFRDESFAVSHHSEGIVSMANKGPHTNGSQFFITLGPTLHLDKKHVAFGKVFDKKSMDVIHRMTQVETDPQTNRPINMQRIQITDCGVGMGPTKSPTPLSLSSVDSREERRHKKKKHKKMSSHHDETKKKKKKKKRSRSRHRRRGYDDIDSDDYSASVSSGDERGKGSDGRRNKRRKHRRGRKTSSRDDCYDDSYSSSATSSSSSSNHDSDDHDEVRRRKKRRHSHQRRSRSDRKRARHTSRTTTHEEKKHSTRHDQKNQKRRKHLHGDTDSSDNNKKERKKKEHN